MFNKATKVILFLILTALSSIGHSAVCPVIEKSPVIDGKLVEPVWRKAFHYSALNDLSGKSKAKPQTGFYMYTDGAKLYIAITATDPQAESLSNKKMQRDNISWSETVEIFFAPDINSTSYFHFAFTPSGGFYDNIAQAMATDHNYDVVFKVSRGKDNWVMEAAIPLKQLEVKGNLRSGDEFDLNITRSTANGRFPQRHQAWSATGDSFHNRKSFARVAVGCYLDVARREIKITEKLLETLKTKPQSYKQLKLKLNTLTQKISHISSDAKFKKFNSLNKQLVKQINLALYAGSKLILSRILPWTLSNDNPIQKFSNDTNSINVSAIKGEVLDIALAVTNPSYQPIRFRCVTDDLTEKETGKQIPVTSVIRTYNATTIGIKGGSTLRDALVEVGKEHPIWIMPMKNEVIWLRIDTSALSGGVWRGGVSFIPLVNHKLKNDIKLSLRIIPARFPKDGKPYSCNWARYEALATSGRLQKAAMEDQHFHGTNVQILYAGTLGFGSVKFDKQGKPLNSPDFSNLDKYIDVFGNKNQLYVFYEKYRCIPRMFGGDNNFSPQAKANFKWFLNKLLEHISKRGLTSKNIAWYPVDEPDLARAKEAIKFNKLLLEADPEQQIFCTLYNSTPMNVLEALCPYVNIWVASFNTKKQQLDLLKSKTKRKPIRWFSYLVLSRATNPMTYRTAGFKALFYGYEGIGFWAYDDAGGGPKPSTWNDFDGRRSDYAVVYEGDNRPQSSVRWRAWHQTIQSYRYVEWLKKLANESPDKKLAEQAKALTAEAINKSIFGKDKNTADNYTDKMRGMAIKLLKANGKIKDSVLEKIFTPTEYCLTSNSESILNCDTKGSYSYNFTPQKRNERCGVTEGEVFFKGENATHGSQSNNRISGTLTDKSAVYPNSWIFWRGSKPFLITFDLKKSYILSSAFIAVDSYPYIKVYKSISVYISQDKKSWKQVADVNMVPITKVKLTKNKLLSISLGKQAGRYVRFEIKTYNGGHLGEVYIHGWPLNSK